MMKTKKAWLFAVVTLVVFLIIATLLDVFLPLAGWDRLLLWLGLVILGAAAAVLIYLQLAPRDPERKRGPTDVELLLEEAQKRLSSSGTVRGRIRKLPVALVIGPTGSAKTSVVMESGLGAELLAGETTAAGGVAPTPGLNVWYARSGVIVEAGGALPQDAERWGKLLRLLRPGRLAAAFGRGRQAPRVAVVCVSCDLLVGTSSSAAVPAATKLRAALAEVSQRLGVRLPVYVVFTKADRLPHFEEFVRGLSREEAEEILGATLPIAELTPGAYADFQSNRLREAFAGIFRSLANWRLDLLPREGRESERGGAYEFPREVRKITDSASAFLLELCRPSQLGINPFLRGFYFTGVRPIVVSDGPAAAAAPYGQQRISLGATGVFGIPGLASTPQPAPRSGTSRRVPEWVFLRRVFPDILFADERAQELTAGGRRVDLLRRGMIAAAAVVLLVLSAGFTVSFVNNRTLLGDGFAALQSVRPLAPAVGEAPDARSLVLLDSLRTAVDDLSEHQRSGRPLRLRWGLYSGNAARAPLRQVYFDRFATLLWTRARGDLVAGLQALPAEAQQTEDYAEAYNALKAYLITTSHPHESTPEFLTPVLLHEWRFGDDLDPDRRELVGRQFDFFARELPLGNPFPADPSEQLVIGARSFLGNFTGLEPFYRALLGEAARAGQGIRFGELYPGSTGVVQNSYVVPPEFTEAGWERVQTILDDLDGFLTREDWVLGERAATDPQNRARLAAELRSRYLTGYAEAWREFLQSGSVLGFSGPADAARKLEVLSSNQSPLLQMLAVIAQHTAVDSSVMRQVFQPVYTLVPPGENDSYVNESNASYMSGLLSLQLAMAQVAEARGPARSDALAQAQMGVQQLDMQVSQLAQGFRTEGDAVLVGNHVQRLLSAPIAAARGLVRGLPTAEVNAAGASFCAPFRTLDAKYPFNDQATQQATIDEIAGTLQRGNSHLWSFYDEQLRDILVAQGNQYVARPAAEPRPTDGFVAFFNRAARISDALFQEGSESPSVRFALQVATSDDLPEVRVSIDGQTQTFTRTLAAGRTFTWDGGRARTVRITGVVDGVEKTLLEGDEGPWTLVRLLRLAQWEQTGAQQYRLRWRLTEDPGELTATITFAARTPIFAPGSMRIDCVSQIVR